jgi:hypothetical protein
MEPSPTATHAPGILQQPALAAATATRAWLIPALKSALAPRPTSQGLAWDFQEIDRECRTELDAVYWMLTVVTRLGHLTDPRVVHPFDADRLNATLSQLASAWEVGTDGASLAQLERPLIARKLALKDAAYRHAQRSPSAVEIPEVQTQRVREIVDTLRTAAGIVRQMGLRTDPISAGVYSGLSQDLLDVDARIRALSKDARAHFGGQMNAMAENNVLFADLRDVLARAAALLEDMPSFERPISDAALPVGTADRDETDREVDAEIAMASESSVWVGLGGEGRRTLLPIQDAIEAVRAYLDDVEERKIARAVAPNRTTPVPRAPTAPAGQPPQRRTARQA